MDLFRVMPINRLRQIAKERTLAFVSYRVFNDDPWEAMLVRALLRNDGIKDVADILLEQGDISALPGLIEAARNADASAYLQCWTKTSEHNLMWDRYGDGNDAVRVRMSNAGRANLPAWITFFEARYEDAFDIRQELRHLASESEVTVSSIIMMNFGGDAAPNQQFNNTVEVVQKP